MEKIIQPCLLCDAPVEVVRSEWEADEAPAALCEDCYPFVRIGIIPWPQVQMLYILRCQVAGLYTKMQVAEQHIKRLYAAQQEFEQELLTLRKQPRVA